MLPTANPVADPPPSGTLPDEQSPAAEEPEKAADRGPSAYVGMLAIAADQFGLGMITPLLPFKVDPVWVGIILTGQYAAVVFGQLCFGVISDRLGRRRVIALVMAVDALFFGVTALFTTRWPLLGIRVAVGFFAPISLSISWVSDVSATKTPDIFRRNFAHVGLAFNLGALLGAVTGGLLGPERWVAANLISAAPCALASLWALASSEPISALAEGASKAVRGVRATLSAFPYRTCLAQYFMSGTILGSFYSLAPVLLQRTHGATSTVIAAVALASAGWNIVNNQLAIRPALAYFGALRIIILSSVLAAVSNLALAFAQGSVIATYALYPVVYVSAALALTVLNICSSGYARRFGENAIGTVNGVSRAVFSTGFGIAPVASVSLWQWRPWAPFVLAAAGWVFAGSLTSYVAGSGDPDPLPGKLSRRFDGGSDTAAVPATAGGRVSASEAS
ncbi:major facilitator superfamily domain-containing protein [Pavlovales sp. CCMP2436]|nr:major facilitator superfamily domain-containing protein [Pavlovales sp. CCMP2436]|mmetsp:Transcript_26461/g.67123  ORF Transcript_26461/g.67123 Transcript_26461/m.67123 type:complete len:450 (+) Transcript_26461:181-1530(+)